MKIKTDYGKRKITLYHTACTVSTNLDAKVIKKDGALIVADRQTGGRGRLGRSFVSNGGGVYMSLYLDTKGETDTLFLTSAAAVAAARAIKLIKGEMPQIKWVNDIYFNNKKVCGILAEGEIAEGVIKSAVLGVGLNLIRKTDFEGELSKKAGFLFENGDFEDLRQAFTEAFLEEFFTLFDEKRKKEIYDTYRQNDYLKGKEITYTENGVLKRGTAAGISGDIGLIVNRGGTETVLKYGEVNISL